MLIVACMCAIASYGQESKSSGKVVRTEPNGVVVYEAKGVQGKSNRKVAAPVVRSSAPTLDELSLEELKERLYHIEQKLEKAQEDGNSEDVSRYKEARKTVVSRIEEIENP